MRYPTPTLLFVWIALSATAAQEAKPAAARANIRRHEYESGHMYYINLDSLRAMKRDVSSFLEWAAPR